MFHQHPAHPPPSLWDRAATTYDLQRRLEWPALEAASGLIEAAGGAGDRLLDVGTGTGAMLRVLEASPRPPERVTAVDSSAAMLARIGALPAGWHAELADARRLPFATARFSAVTACYLLHVLAPSERAAVLAEIHRVLRPGGLIVTVTVAPGGGLSTAPLRALARRGARSAGALAGLRVVDPRGDLQAAGFELIAERTVRRGYPSLCIAAARS